MDNTRYGSGDETVRQLDRDILALIEEGVAAPHDDARFNSLALRVFEYQFERNGAYGGFCRGRGANPSTLKHWSEMPAVPTMAFKELPLACFPVEQAAALYLSSGTTGSGRSRHYLETLDLYDASLMANFKACVLPDFERIPMLILGPPATVLPQSSLTHMFEVVAEFLSTAGGDFYMDAAGLKRDWLAERLGDSQRHGLPVCLLGTAFAFVHFLDYCSGEGLRFRLAPGSRIMDTGGFKGRSREVPKPELLRLYASFFGIPAHHVINEYGMTEMGSQFYDNCLLKPGQSPRRKVVPPWVRTLVVDPETLQPLPEGQPGLLRHYDLANRSSVMAIQTDDMGVRIGDGFEILGRAGGAEARGCSIAVDEMLSQGR